MRGNMELWGIKASIKPASVVVTLKSLLECRLILNLQTIPVTI